MVSRTITSVIEAWHASRNLQAACTFVELTQAALLIICSAPSLLFNDLARPNPLIYAMPFLFLLGLQNATIKTLLKLEGSGIKSGGVLTALGVELGNIVSDANPTSDGRSITESSKRVALLASMAGSFVGGMLLGLLGFHRFGFLSFLFLAAALVSASSVRFLKALLY